MMAVLSECIQVPADTQLLTIAMTLVMLVMPLVADVFVCKLVLSCSTVPRCRC